MHEVLSILPLEHEQYGVFRQFLQSSLPKDIHESCGRLYSSCQLSRLLPCSQILTWVRYQGSNQLGDNAVSHTFYRSLGK